MRIVRMFTGADGLSNFEEVDLPANASGGAEMVLMLKAAGAVTIRKVFPGPAGGWHPAPQRQYVVMLSGEMEVEVAAGVARRFRPGDVLLTEDLTGKGHITRTVGDQPRVLLNIPLEP